MSIQRKPDERAFRFLELCIARRNDRPDEEVARNHGLTVEWMYRQLANDGFPVCPECGALHPDEGHRRGHAAIRRRARGSGERRPVEVTVAAAVPLFERAAEKMREGVEDVRRLRLRRHGRRFVAKHVLKGVAGKQVLNDPERPRVGLEGESVLVIERENAHPVYWRELCEKHGLDPDDPKRSSVMVPMDYDRPEGGRDAPPGSLVAQVANYVLTGGDVEELLAALHPEPEEVDRDKLYKDDRARPGPVAALRLYAEQVATVACGGEVTEGRRPPEVSRDEHRAAAFIQEQDARGATDEEIVAALKDRALWPLSIPITLNEVRRIRGLNLS